MLRSQGYIDSWTQKGVIASLQIKMAHDLILKIIFNSFQSLKNNGAK